MQNIFLQTSFIAAFAAGIVALFAPCCITFLLPAYLGSVFKEKEKVLFMTLVFASGIFVVLVPAVLGVAALSKTLFTYHDPIYFVGGFVMLAVAAVTLLGLKLPMPNLPGVKPGKTDVLSIFTLGIFSGITSACCAPVLIGVLTLSFLSPSFFGAILIGAFYVLGMVTPLLIISMFLHGKIDKFMFLRKPLFDYSLFGRKNTVMTSNFLAGLIFLVTGVLIVYLNYLGKLGMQDIEGFTKVITNAGGYVNEFVGGNVLANIVFAILVIFAIYKISKKV